MRLLLRLQVLLLQQQVRDGVRRDHQHRRTRKVRKVKAQGAYPLTQLREAHQNHSGRNKHTRRQHPLPDQNRGAGAQQTAGHGQGRSSQRQSGQKQPVMT